MHSAQPALALSRRHDGIQATSVRRASLIDTVSAARALLGCLLVRDDEHGLRVGRIVETEAYLRDDPACHAFRGRDARNGSMFERAGTAYVYRLHRSYCFNVVTGARGCGEAVLVRALEPVEGMEAMQRARERRTVGHTAPRGFALTNGPGKLCQALDIDTGLDGAALLAVASKRAPLRLLACAGALDVGVSTRIGISQGRDARLRFFVRDNPWVSR